MLRFGLRSGPGQLPCSLTPTDRIQEMDRKPRETMNTVAIARRRRGSVELVGQIGRDDFLDIDLFSTRLLSGVFKRQHGCGKAFLREIAQRRQPLERRHFRRQPLRRPRQPAALGGDARGQRIHTRLQYGNTGAVAVELLVF